jgi:hypothetical protein
MEATAFRFAGCVGGGGGGTETDGAGGTYSRSLPLKDGVGGRLLAGVVRGDSVGLSFLILMEGTAEVLGTRGGGRDAALVAEGPAGE